MSADFNFEIINKGYGETLFVVSDGLSKYSFTARGQKAKNQVIKFLKKGKMSALAVISNYCSVFKEIQTHCRVKYGQNNNN